jgi:ElaB/YqjD/DUF883 family membrane-anchored ribosome-binding protein
MDIPEPKSPSFAPSVTPPVATVEDVQRDLRLLRDDVARLTQEMTNYVSKTGRKAIRDANEQLEDVVRERPIAAVAIAMGLGFLCGAAAFWRR